MALGNSSLRTLSLTLLIICGPSSFTHCLPWENPTPEELTSFVYAPGVLVSEMLMGRYCPYFIASTGEIITCSKGIEVITHPATSCNLSEIQLKQVNKKTLQKKRKQVKNKRTHKESLISLALTPFRAMWYTASHIANWVFGITVKKPKGKRLDESLSMYWADPTKVNLAQDNDLALFKDVYEKHVEAVQEQDPRHTNVVLYGTSRGSATIFNFCGLYQPAHVRALVCEGLFDSVEHIATATNASRIRLLIKLLPKITEFSHDGILPIKMVSSIPLTMPILLITSYKDSTVPRECTLQIYKELRATGHDNVHILQCKKCSHIGYPSGKEKKLYESVVHAFYRHYNLPHIPALAEAGHEHFINKTQPTWC